MGMSPRPGRRQRDRPVGAQPQASEGVGLRAGWQRRGTMVLVMALTPGATAETASDSTRPPCENLQEGRAQDVGPRGAGDRLSIAACDEWVTAAHIS